MSSIVIASVYPAERKMTFPWGPIGIASTTYVLPAAGLGSVSTLVVEDAYQRNYYGEDVGFRNDLQTAALTAQNLVYCWAVAVLGSTGDAHPGIWVCAGNKPSPDEIAQNRKVQEAYFENLVIEADAEWKQGRPRNVTELARQAATWMGKADAYEWVKPMTQIAQEDCPLCKIKIPAGAIICPNCRGQIREMPKELASFKRVG